jgi:hypothetical protein
VFREIQALGRLRLGERDGSVSAGPAASVPVVLAASEAQVLVPA